MEAGTSLAGLSSALDPSTAAAPDLPARVRAALEQATKELLAARTPDGHWEGELSSSALSTATAVIALAVAQKESQLQSPPSDRISNGLAWLAKHANADGGWGDTIHSLSNISTTALCWAAFGVVPSADEQYKNIVSHAERWLGQNSEQHSSPLDTSHSALVTAILARYGKDRTFSAPILTACALSGRLGSSADAWQQVLPLPFELAAFPRQWFAALRLPAVYQFPEMAEQGGLIGYGPRIVRLFRDVLSRQLANLLRGSKPADLPVEQPTKFELVINLKTAKALGLTVPDSLLARADGVIE